MRKYVIYMYILIFAVGCFSTYASYKDNGSGIILPVELEEKIVKQGVIKSIDKIHKAISFKKANSDFLFLNLSLFLIGHWEGAWHGDLLIRRPINDKDWNNCEILHPHSVFDVKFIPFLTEEDIIEMTDEHFNKKYLDLEKDLRSLCGGKSEILDAEIELLKKYTGKEDDGVEVDGVSEIDGGRH